MAPHVQRVFGASSGAVGKLLFFLLFADPSPFSLPFVCLPLVLSRFWRVLHPSPLRFLFHFAPLLDPHPAGPPISSATAPYCEKRKSKGRSQNAKLG